MNNESSNPLRENVDRQFLAMLLAENTAREKQLAQYDAKVTIQETIAHAVLARSTVVTPAIVANTLSNGHIKVDTLARETAEDVAHFDKLDEKPIKAQQDEQLERRHQLDRYEESITLREWAVNRVQQMLNQSASTGGESQEPATAATPKA